MRPKHARRGVGEAPCYTPAPVDWEEITAA